MSKAFTRESDTDGDDDELPVAPVPTGKNYITRAGYERLRTELFALIDEERPKIVDIVHWAASNGDRSENGDYLYGKKRLREIDRRIRFLTRRLEIAEVVDPSLHHGGDQVFFGATVSYADDAGGRGRQRAGPDQLDIAGGARPDQGPCGRCGASGGARRRAGAGSAGRAVSGARQRLVTGPQGL
jgi:transcription elongation factor GreB